MSSYRNINNVMTEIKCTNCKQIKSVKEFHIYKRHGEYIYNQWCYDCEKDRKKSEQPKASDFCKKCVNFSVLRQKCKLGKKKLEKCADYDEFLYYNL